MIDNDEAGLKEKPEETRCIAKYLARHQIHTKKSPNDLGPQ